MSDQIFIDQFSILRPGKLFEQISDEKVLALSWKQPFASAMLYGKIETRVWHTAYRGIVLICASKKEYSDFSLQDICGGKQLGRLLTTLSAEFGGKGKTVESTLGMAIAVGLLSDCRPMLPIDEDKCFAKYREPWIKEAKPDASGLRPPGTKKMLWCHVYRNVMPIEPFVWKGSQGWKELTIDIKQKIILL